jgi:hypothetical protein
MWTRRELLKLNGEASPVSSSFAWEANLWPVEDTPVTLQGYFWKGGEGRR